MVFHFRLAPLLRIRSLREELERERLLRESLKAREAEDRARKLSELRFETREAFLGAQAAFTGSELQFFANCSACSAIAEAGAKRSAAAAAISRDEQRKKYESAHRDSLILEKLRERQLEAFRLQEARAEQKRLDEAHLLVAGRTLRRSL